MIVDIFDIYMFFGVIVLRVKLINIIVFLLLICNRDYLEMCIVVLIMLNVVRLCSLYDII